ncbi:MAG: hypothetical protein ACTSRU_17410 [Candidatus Hodarchaeales archaeon]
MGINKQQIIRNQLEKTLESKQQGYNDEWTYPSMSEEVLTNCKKVISRLSEYYLELMDIAYAYNSINMNWRTEELGIIASVQVYKESVGCSIPYQRISADCDFEKFLEIAEGIAKVFVK